MLSPVTASSPSRGIELPRHHGYRSRSRTALRYRLLEFLRVVFLLVPPQGEGDGGDLPRQRQFGQIRLRSPLEQLVVMPIQGFLLRLLDHRGGRALEDGLQHVIEILVQPARLLALGLRPCPTGRALPI